MAGERSRHGQSDPYDALPYECRAVPMTHVDRLALIALAHGMRPAPPTRCRVLELGAGNGANLLAMAFHLDESHFVAVERSEVQHQAAVAARNRLGVSNLEVRYADLLELPDDLGTFDYVIVHGVFSWVPPRVRERILELCARHLAPQGVAYVSYNTFPGWGVRGQVREAMLLQAREGGDFRDRIARARRTLALLAAANAGVRTEYGALLAREIAHAQESRDAYLLHEYLAEHNQPFHFREFMAMATAHGLAYLDEVTAALHDSNTEAAVRGRMGQLVPDPVAAEQLADQVFYRQFRATLLCRPEAKPTPKRDASAVLRQCLIAGGLTPESRRPSLEPDVSESFLVSDGIRVATPHPLLKAALLELRRAWPASLSFADLCTRAAALLSVRGVYPDDGAVSEIERESLANDLVALQSVGHLEFRTWQPPVPRSPGAAPRVSALTRLEAEQSPWVTSLHHRAVELDPFARVLVRHLDGTRDVAALTERMAAAFAQGDLAIRREEGGDPTPDEVREMLPGLIEKSVGLLGQMALLVARG